MAVLLAFLLVVAGLGALLLGGEGLVTGAVRLAEKLGVSPLAIGLTVVAFGTSAPELAVSVIAAYKGTPDIAIGNIFGSNIFNILVAVGGPAALTGLVIRRELFKREIPFCVVANLLVIGLASTGLLLERWEGVLLLAVLFVFLLWVARTGRSEEAEDDPIEGDRTAQAFAGVAILSGIGAIAAGYDHALHLWALMAGTAICMAVMTFNQRMRGLAGAILLLPVGLALLVGGSQVLVTGATAIARAMNVSEAAIGLTVVAIGTSAPELAAGISAARRGLSDIVLGNALGSNLFNLLSVLGTASLIRPMEVARQFLELDAWVALLTVVLLLPLAASRTGQLSRFAGLLLVCLWVAYTTVLLAMETNPGVL